MPTMNSDKARNPRRVIEVDPKRLAHGVWNSEHNRRDREGDIVASYSADVIGDGGRVRKPFRLRGCVWVATSVVVGRVQAYRLRELAAFDGPATTYSEKTRDDCGERARNDPMGFYHGMTVTHRGTAYVLDGPPVTLVAGDPQPTQGELFT